MASGGSCWYDECERENMRSWGKNNRGVLRESTAKSFLALVSIAMHRLDGYDPSGGSCWYDKCERESTSN